MNKRTAYLISFLALALFVNTSVPMTKTEAVSKVAETIQEIADDFGIGEAQAAQGGPNSFRVGIQDDTGNNGGCSNDYRDYGWAGYTPPSGVDSGYVTDGNGKDPNCARIQMDAGSTALSNGAMYTTDFRLGIALSESENGCNDRRSTTSWTPWASQGGGSASNYASGSIDAADCIWIYYETRPIPDGSVRIIDAQAGIRVGNGGYRYTPWASQGGGWSGWSITSGQDFTSAGISLTARLNYKYNADYTSTTIPQFPPNTLTLNQTLTNRQIVMRNIPDVGASTAMPWVSDEVVSSSTNRSVSYCSEWTPTSASDTCTQTTVYTSTKFKLRRIDGNTSAVETTSGDLPYRRTVVSQWGASQVWYEGQCYPTGGGDGPIVYDSGSGNNFANAFGLIKTAHALPIGPGEEQCDPPYPSDPPEYNPVFMSWNQGPDVLNNENATFELNLTPRQNGQFQLQFQMVNIDTGELFGDPNAAGNSNTIARITVSTGGFGLSCTANQTILAGQNVNYAINAVGSPTNPINVTLTSGTPPTMTNSPLVLNSSNGYAGVAVLSTAGMSPGTYNLVFSGSDGTTTATCPAQLTLTGGTQVTGSTNLAIYQYATAPLTVNGGTTADVYVNSNVTLAWTPTGTVSGSTCVAGNAWSGNKASTPGQAYSETVNVGSTPGTRTYTIYCQGPLSSYSNLSIVTVNVSNPTPTGWIECNGSGDSCTVAAGATPTITWGSTNVSSCTVSRGSTATWTGTSGSQTSAPVNAQVIYNLDCTGSFGNIHDEVSVNISGPPTNPQGFNNVCGQITVTWSPPSGGATPTSYNIYRRTASGSYGSPLATNVTSPYVNSMASDPTLAANTLYYYAVTAVYGGLESAMAEIPSALSVTACNASFNGSYKKIVGAGNSVPTFSRCSGSGGGFTLPTGQIFQSGDNVFFEICVRNGGTLELTSVTVTEILAQDRNLQDVQFVNADGNCASGSGSGPYTIGTMAPNQVCSILVRATIANPGGPTSSLHYFVNYAQLASTQISSTVNTLPEPFVIGSDVPDRQEVPR